MKPLVSILIPAYNAEAWVAGTIRSAMDQTWPRKEIIIVNDGSTDGTLQVIRRFEGSDIKVINQENQGASGARNTAYSLCQGDYVQWLDADDQLAPSKIEIQVRAAELVNEPRILYSGSWGHFFYRIDRAHFSPSPLWKDLSPVDWLSLKMAKNLHMQPDCWLVSRELTDAAGPWDTRLWRDNDGEYFCRVILASKKIHFVKDAISYYRRSGHRSVSYIGNSKKKIESLFLSMEKHIGYLLSLEDSVRTRAACCAYLETWQLNFFPNRMDLVEQLRKMAAELGGELREPEMSWKYRYIRRALGWDAMKRCRRQVTLWKESGYRAWDYFLYRLGA